MSFFFGICLTKLYPKIRLNNNGNNNISALKRL